MTSRIVPEAWMPSASIVRVIFHWTAGTHKATDFDRAHYHVLVEADGKVVRGIPVISGNSAKNRKGKIAHHTLNTNTGSAGVSACCMGGAVESPFNPGKYPLTKAQWENLALVIADLCDKYKIPVTSRTVLSHAEVQPNLGIRQRGKWDFTRLAFDPSVKGAKACGDNMRNLVQAALKGTVNPLALVEDGDGGEPDEPIPTRRSVPSLMPVEISSRNRSKDDVPQGDRDVWDLQRRLKAMNYDPGTLDGVWGGKTAGAVSGFLNDRETTMQGPTSYEDFMLVKDDLREIIRQSEEESPPFVRPVTEARKNADPDIVAARAPETVPVKRNFWAGMWATISGALALAFETVKGWFSSAWDFWAENKDALPDDKSWLQTVWEHFASIPPTFWIVAAIGVFGFITYNSYRANKISVDQVRTGER